MPSQWWVAILVAVITVSVPGLIAFFRYRKTDTIDLAERYEAMATRQAKKIEDLQKRIAILEDKVREMERREIEHLATIERLAGELAEKEC